MRLLGEMPERLNGTVSKTVVRFSVPRVRIPLSPPKILGGPEAPNIFDDSGFEPEQRVRQNGRIAVLDSSAARAPKGFAPWMARINPSLSAKTKGPPNIFDDSGFEPEQRVRQNGRIAVLDSSAARAPKGFAPWMARINPSLSTRSL